MYKMPMLLNCLLNQTASVDQQKHDKTAITLRIA